MKINPINYFAIVATEKDRKKLQSLLKTPVICDDNLYHHYNQLTCKHTKTHVQGVIEYCNDCWKALKEI